MVHADSGRSYGNGNLYTLADRNWQAMPPPEREELRSVVRDAKRHLGQLTALAARV